jgi:hypothetical protein
MDISARIIVADCVIRVFALRPRQAKQSRNKLKWRCAERKYAYKRVSGATLNK